MREKMFALLFAACIFPMISSMAIAQDQSHIVIYDARADHLDEDSDGDFDIVRVVASIGTSAGNAIIAIEVIASTEDISISFWDNTTLESGTTHQVNITVKAWSDSDYTIQFRVWDVDSGMVVHDEDLGDHSLVASLTPPQLSMELEAEEFIFTGDTCWVHRISTDLVGAHYDEMGMISIQGVPWLVGEYETPLDCSKWPAGEYTIIENYVNGLGMVATAELSFKINIHPPPSFVVEIVGANSEVGTPCQLMINGTQDTMIQEMEIEWEVIDPGQANTEYEDLVLVDCAMWAPGVHKIRATLISPQGRSTTEALNIVRLPPSDDASLEVKNASGDSARWPEVSAGSDYEPTPLFMSLSATIAVVGAGGFLIAIIMGIIVAGIMGREQQEEQDDLWAENLAPDSEGMPTYVDDQGIHWRQRPDDSVDWWDQSNNEWVAFE
ncbi:MAG: hypothetical protein QF440_00475 [Candidatus Thalassarchaeaceae archaeon]|nr:hypothetical protein [Candidatus Thalassarchaeaceae archaeon]